MSEYERQNRGLAYEPSATDSPTRDKTPRGDRAGNRT